MRIINYQRGVMMTKEENFKKIWELIELPVILMIAWTIISLAADFEGLLGTTIASILGWMVTLLVFGYVGLIAVKNSQTIGFSAKIGAITGAISGLVGAILTIGWYYIFPGRFANVIVQMMSAGMAEKAADSMLQVGLLFGIITGPIANAVLGTIIAVIAALIFSKVLKINSNNHNTNTCAENTVKKTVKKSKSKKKK